MKDNIDKSIFLDENFESIYTQLQKNLNTEYKEFPYFLNFYENFPKTGKQGLLGLLKYKKGEIKNKIVYKISQYMNYLVHQENMVMQSLNRVRNFCPNFCKGYGLLKIPISPDFRKVENPFQIQDKLKIEGEVLLMEFIDPAKKLYRYLKNESIDESIIFSLIKQTLLAIQIAQNKVQFTHYDLHSNNVLVKKCNPNSCVLYILNKDQQFLVPTYGNYPVIIDYGFSYVNDMQGNPLYSALPHTDVGFMSDRFDSIADPKLFLITVSDELKGYKGTKNAKLFRKLVRNLFKPLKVDWESGWDTNHDVSASDYIVNLLEETEADSKSKFFKHCGHYCIDIAQKLITLPLQKHKYKKIDKIYSVIISEFKKIEREISSDFYNLYIFKKMIDFASEVKDEYLNDDNRKEAVKKFKNNLLNLIMGIAKFSNPKLDFETLLCSLFIFARNMEGILYEVMTERMKEKEKQYSKMKIQTSFEICEAIEANIPSEFVLNNETIIYIYDCINETSKTVCLPEKYLNDINSLHTLEQGRFIYELISAKECFYKSDNKNSDVDESRDENSDVDESRDENSDVEESVDEIDENENESQDEDLNENNQDESDDDFDDESDDDFDEEDDFNDYFHSDMSGSEFERTLEEISKKN